MTELKRAVFVLTGPSGAGKNKKIEAMMRRDYRLGMPVSATTRPPRDGETDGVDYFFTTREKFMGMVEAGRFLEWEENHGNLYGTPLEAFALIHAEGKDAIIDVDVRGARSLKRLMPEAITIFIFASPEQLERQLRERGKDSEDVIQRRLVSAAAELEQCTDFDHVIVNDDYERADDDLHKLILGARCRPTHPDSHEMASQTL